MNAMYYSRVPHKSVHMSVCMYSRYTAKGVEIGWGWDLFSAPASSTAAKGAKVVRGTWYVVFRKDLSCYQTFPKAPCSVQFWQP